MRIVFAALAFVALSFVAGVAGDLSAAPPAPNSGQAVTLRIPPPIPDDAPRARPLVTTPQAQAAPPPRVQEVRQTLSRPVPVDIRAPEFDSLAPISEAQLELAPLLSADSAEAAPEKHKFEAALDA